jgi:hypothetical protein
MKLRRTEHSFRKWSHYYRKLPAYINLHTTSFCDVRKGDRNDRTNDKQISNAFAKIHKSRGDLALSSTQVLFSTLLAGENTLAGAGHVYPKFWVEKSIIPVGGVVCLSRLENRNFMLYSFGW